MSRHKFNDTSWPKGMILAWSGQRINKFKHYPAYKGAPGKGDLAGWAIMDGAFYGDERVPDRSNEIETHKDGRAVIFDYAPIVKM